MSDPPIPAFPDGNAGVGAMRTSPTTSLNRARGAEVYSFSRLVWRIVSIGGGGSWQDRTGAAAPRPGSGS